MTRLTRAIPMLAALVLAFAFSTPTQAAKKKVYMSYILHGNMNYDRYVRPTIWRDFPKIYDGLLDFMDEYPDFCGQLQFSGQTLGSMRQAAPDVLDHAMRIHRRGQLNFTGTFYSEPVNVNMDGETNYLCAWLGTKIATDFAGTTDGYYLQERAYHPQLPWILNHAGVTWAPVITGDDSFYPFRLRGMDGSVSTCVPVTRDSLREKILRAPKNSLIVVEEDYEIPSSFTHTYDMVKKLNAEQTGIEVVWITVKDYIKRFGVKGERYVDHSAKARNRDNGTYSRWTADPLDIVLQGYTLRAMNDFRAARIMSALTSGIYGAEADIPFDGSGVTLKEDPLTWNIERADLYPDVEPKYLSRGGKITLLSRAEHLLLWAVNSDAKGWFPLYEKRRERALSLENSSLLSREVISRGMRQIAGKIALSGYDKYFMALNLEPQRSQTVTVEIDQPMQAYDYATGQALSSECVSAGDGGKYKLSFQATLPSYGYSVVGLKRVASPQSALWHEGNSISAQGLTVKAEGTSVTLSGAGSETTIQLDSFRIKALAEMTEGRGDGEWRDAREYGAARISVRQGALGPQLRVERQIDWLVHCEQTYTITDGKVVCDVRYIFPHPTLVRHDGAKKGNTFDPRGLSLTFHTGAAGVVYYDIPFGTSRYDKPGMSYFCPLTTLFLEHSGGSGFVVSPTTGEQAFGVNADSGDITLYLGASTTSGPIRDVGMTFRDKTTVDHEPAWYAEPFHGEYKHSIVLFPYQGGWQNAHVAAQSRAASQPVYVSECLAGASASLPASASVVSYSQPNVEITSMEPAEGGIEVRLNEKEGRAADFTMKVAGSDVSMSVPAFGIVTSKIPAKEKK